MVVPGGCGFPGSARTAARVPMDIPCVRVFVLGRTNAVRCIPWFGSGLSLILQSTNNNTKKHNTTQQQKKEERKKMGSAGEKKKTEAGRS